MKYYIEILDWSAESFRRARQDILKMTIDEVEWCTDINCHVAELSDKPSESKMILARFYNECFISDGIHVRFTTSPGLPN